MLSVLVLCHVFLVSYFLLLLFSVLTCAGEIDPVLRGMLVQHSESIDVKVVDEMRNFLFAAAHGLGHFDLVAINIQRGRDHALPDFNHMRTLLGLPRYTSMGEITTCAFCLTVLSW